MSTFNIERFEEMRDAYECIDELKEHIENFIEIFEEMEDAYERIEIEFDEMKNIIDNNPF